MKIRVQSGASYKIQMGQYEPGEVSSSVEIEKEFDDSIDIVKATEDLQGIADNLVDLDIRARIKKSVARYREIRKLL